MSKGSKRRPAAVPREQVDEAWERTFGRAAEGTERLTPLLATPDVDGGKALRYKTPEPL